MKKPTKTSHTPAEKKEPFLTSREQAALAVIFFVALGLRILHILALRDMPPVSDALEYHDYAVNMLKTFKFGTAAAPTYRGPGYPAFLSIVYFLYGYSYQIARVAQAFVSSFSCILLYMLGRKLFSRATGYAAAIIGAFFSLYIFYSGFLVTEVFYILLLLIFTLSLFAVLDDPSKKNIMWCGIILGVAALTRVEILFTFVFIAAAIFIYYKFDILKTFGHIAAILFFACAVILPWTLRNYMVTRSFVLVSSQGGENLWMGAHPGATGMHVTISNEVINKYRNREELNKALTKEAVQFIKHNPGKWLRLCWIKFRYFFYYWIDESQWLFKEQFIFIGKWRPPLLSISMIGILAAIGIVLTIKRAQYLLILYAFLVSNIAMQMILYAEHRFRMQITPFLIIFAASPVYYIEIFLRSIRSKKVQ